MNERETMINVAYMANEFWGDKKEEKKKKEEPIDCYKLERFQYSLENW